MSELIERLNLIGLVNDEDRKVLDETAARIRELEGMDAAHKQDRSDVVGTIGNALGLDETTTFSAVCMRAWDFIRLVTKSSGDEDPIALIEAAKKLPMTADKKRVTPHMPMYCMSGKMYRAGSLLWAEPVVSLDARSVCDMLFSAREAAEAAKVKA